MALHALSDTEAPDISASTATKVAPTTELAASNTPLNAGVSPPSRQPSPVTDFCRTKST